jgi:DnaJ-class molecular chaperone
MKETGPTMYKEKCYKCDGKGVIKGDNGYGGEREFTCSNCWGIGYHDRKTDEELMAEFKREQDGLSTQCKL